MNFGQVAGWFNQALERGSEYYLRLKQLEAATEVNKTKSREQIEAEKQKTKQILYIAMGIIALGVVVKIVRSRR